MKLTQDNYYSDEANRAYMSCSQIKAFMRCPFAWHRQYVTGEYRPEESTALLVGSYVDLALLEPDKLDEFVRDKRDAICTKRGDLRADFKQAEIMANAVANQPYAMGLLDGEAQRIMTGEINGVPFKCKIDALHVDKGILVDLKTTRDIDHREWDDAKKAKVHWINYWDYWMQTLIYSVLCEQNGIDINEAYIVAVDKQSPPSVRVFDMNNKAKLREANATLSRALYEMVDVFDKAGAEPGDYHRCEKCVCCRETAKVTEPVVFDGNEWS